MIAPLLAPAEEAQPGRGADRDWDVPLVLQPAWGPSWDGAPTGSDEHP
jgi:hypothetical protein